ncbi:hypothetical protein BJ508DRAFT_328425 [Ascobolus immersus RN42]|uniref:Uncharacterized protein n=1 Tax=Ascobolus immersus RN42 TaxID=1160509 RepID=A0A3N4I594_ASCIM|nr:hypothetical protein BJ508DRAFT_328425 [Ascobolus immersus RN42]
MSAPEKSSTTRQSSMDKLGRSLDRGTPTSSLTQQLQLLDLKNPSPPSLEIENFAIGHDNTVTQVLPLALQRCKIPTSDARNYAFIMILDLEYDWQDKELVELDLALDAKPLFLVRHLRKIGIWPTFTMRRKERIEIETFTTKGFTYSIAHKDLALFSFALGIINPMDKNKYLRIEMAPSTTLPLDVIWGIINFGYQPRFRVRKRSEKELYTTGREPTLPPVEKLKGSREGKAERRESSHEAFYLRRLGERDRKRPKRGFPVWTYTATRHARDIQAEARRKERGLVG